MTEATPEARDVIAVASASKLGRPHVYANELFYDICGRVADGEKLLDICKEPGMPDRRTFFRWVMQIPSVQSQYRAALMLRKDALIEQVMEIAADSSRDFVVIESPGEGDEPPTIDKVFDKEHFKRVKLHIDSLFRIVELETPKKYGDAIDPPAAPGNGDNAKPAEGAQVIENDPLHAAINAFRQAADKAAKGGFG